MFAKTRVDQNVGFFTKMFKSIIISQPIDLGNPVVLELSDIGLSVVTNDYFLRKYPCTAPFEASIPYDLSSQIIDFMIYGYLKDGAIRAAFQLLFTDRDTLTRFYRKYFCKRYVTVYPRYRDMISRISKIFYIIDNVYDDMYYDPRSDDTLVAPYDDDDLEFDLVFGHQFYCKDAFTYPWDICDLPSLRFYVPDSCISLYPEISYHYIKTGNFKKDTLWISGGASRGVISTYFFKTPVILLSFTDSEGRSLVDLETIVSKPWRALSALCRLVFGGNAGVFVFLDTEKYYELVFHDDVCVEI